MVSNDGFPKKKCVILFQLQQSRVQENQTYRGHQIMHAYYLLHSGAPLDLMWRSVQQNGGISGEGEQKVDNFCGLWMIQHPFNLMSGGILFSPCQETGEEMDKQKTPKNYMLTQPDCSGLRISMNITRSRLSNHHSYEMSVYFKKRLLLKTVATFLPNFLAARKILGVLHSNALVFLPY